jgi:hypothetical protein
MFALDHPGGAQSRRVLILAIAQGILSHAAECVKARQAFSAEVFALSGRTLGVRGI